MSDAGFPSCKDKDVLDRKEDEDRADYLVRQWANAEKLGAAAREMCHIAMGIIANAYEGDWDKATDEWRGAAERWVESYNEDLA